MSININLSFFSRNTYIEGAQLKHKMPQSLFITSPDPEPDWENKSKEEWIELFVDKLVRMLPASGTLNTSYSGLFDHLTANEQLIYRQIDRDVERWMYTWGYLKKESPSSYYGYATPLGMRAKAADGHFAYQKQLEERNKPQPTNIVNIGGNNSGIVAQANQERFVARNIPAMEMKNTETASNIKPKWRSVLEVICWVIGAIAAGLAIWEFAIKNLVH